MIKCKIPTNFALAISKKSKISRASIKYRTSKFFKNFFKEKTRSKKELEKNFHFDLYTSIYKEENIDTKT